MRNAVGIFVMLFAFVAVQAQTKVAHINSSQLIEAMPEADSIQKKLMKELVLNIGIIQTHKK